MRRREFIKLLGVSAVAWPLTARGQQRDRVRQIGVLSPFSETDPETKAKLAALKDRLEQLGWIDGRNIRIEYRFSDGKHRPHARRGGGAGSAYSRSDRCLRKSGSVGAEADHQQYPDRFYPSVRSGWKWIRHGPRASWRQHYWIPQL